MRRSVCLPVLALCATASCARLGGQPPDALEVYTGGATASETLPLIVTLHGYGGMPRNIVRIVEGLGARARVFAPHGLFPVGLGWGWFALSQRHEPEELAPGISHAADVLTQKIAEEQRARPTCGRPIVVGFSQGGFLAYALAARNPPVVGAAFPIAGYLPPSLRPKTKPSGAPRVEAFHGGSDGIVDHAWGESTEASFTAAGYAGSMHLYPGVVHTVVHEEAAEVRAAIEQAIRDAGCATARP